MLQSFYINYSEIYLHRNSFYTVANPNPGQWLLGPNVKSLPRWLFDTVKQLTDWA
jgi:hypothetical protein